MKPLRSSVLTSGDPCGSWIVRKKNATEIWLQFRASGTDAGCCVSALRGRLGRVGCAAFLSWTASESIRCRALLSPFQTRLADHGGVIWMTVS